MITLCLNWFIWNLYNHKNGVVQTLHWENFGGLYWKLTVCHAAVQVNAIIILHVGVCLSICLPFCLSVYLSVCLTVYNLSPVYLSGFFLSIDSLSVLPSDYLPVCPLSVFLSLCLYFYLSAYLSFYLYVLLLLVSLYFCLSTVCVSTWQSICWLLPVFLNLYICLSDHLFVYLSDYLAAYPLPSSYQHPLNSWKHWGSKISESSVTSKQFTHTFHTPEEVVEKHKVTKTLEFPYICVTKN
jgi:hypothetical protein